MTAFHEGEEVEVHYPFSRSNEATWPWVKAKIVAWEPGYGSPIAHQVQFPDGTRAVFDADHIREIRQTPTGFSGSHMVVRNITGDRP